LNEEVQKEGARIGCRLTAALDEDHDRQLHVGCSVGRAPDVDEEAVLVMEIVWGLGYAVTCRPKLSCRRSEASSSTDEENIQDT
jgi:hypothetical protein